MKYSILYITTLIIGSLLITLTSGCTLVRLIAGATSSKKAETISGWHYEQVQIGSKVVMTMTDGSVRKGFFKGKRLEPVDSYAVRYTAWFYALEDTTGIPLPGDVITLSLSSGEKRISTFLGLDKDVLYISTGKRGYESISIKAIESLSSLEHGACSGRKLLSLVEHVDTPVRTVLALSARPHDTIPNTYFNPDDVELIYIAGHNYAATGMLVGMAVDLTLAAMVLNDIEK